jgi:hypothetical protein
MGSRRPFSFIRRSCALAPSWSCALVTPCRQRSEHEKDRNCLFPPRLPAIYRKGTKPGQAIALKFRWNRRNPSIYLMRDSPLRAWPIFINFRPGNSDAWVSSSQRSLRFVGLHQNFIWRARRILSLEPGSLMPRSQRLPTRC